METSSVFYAKCDYTPEEIHYIKTNYKLLSCKQIAKRLGRSPSAITSKAHYLGVRKRVYLPDHERSLRSLHSKGYSDYKISLIVNISRQVVTRWRNSNSLPINTSKQEIMQRVRNIATRKARELGYNSFPEHFADLRRDTNTS